jgi:hypothetical protein
VRHDMLAKITVVAGLLGLFAVFGGTSAATAAPRAAGSAHNAATVAGAAPRAGHVTCCRLPRSWDQSVGFSATSMGPPGCQ